MTEFLRELYRRSPILSVAACIHAICATVALALMALDSPTVLGLNVWIKPWRFATSIAAYLFTVAWLIGDLQGPRRALLWISRGTSIALLTEMALIMIQAGRGARSAFNMETAFDSAVFQIMGIVILFNLFLAGWLLVLYFRKQASLPLAYVWGVRFGLILMLVAGFESSSIAAALSHSIGVADGGPGLPLFNWSIEGGDLRIAHFIGIHAMQVLPVAGWLLGRYRESASVPLVFAVAGAYALLMTIALAQASSGTPVFQFLH